MVRLINIRRYIRKMTSSINISKTVNYTLDVNPKQRLLEAVFFKK